MSSRTLIGVVVGDKADKTISIKVERVFKHPVYHKTVKRSRKYAVHDPENVCRVGDVVEIVESKPISRTKRWLFSEKISLAS